MEMRLNVICRGAFLSEIRNKASELKISKADQSRVEDGRGGFRLSVAVGVSFAAPPQSDLP